MLLNIPPELTRILTETPELKQGYLVGGCVRDSLLAMETKDIDVEVFGISFEQLAGALSRLGRTDSVGRSFGVVKLTLPGASVIDFSIPRRDSKIAPGHKGFEIHFDPDIAPAEAAGRRDFTINSLMYDPREDRLLDFFGGAEDIRNRVLRHTSEAFVEDPLRVLRGMQFAGRFALTGAPETIELCRRIKNSYHELAPERVREEWFKWAEKSARPSAGLEFLLATDWIEHYPELKALKETPQDPEWHPEGDVFIHTCHCCDAMVSLPEWKQAGPRSRIVYMLAILVHDFAKPMTTRRKLKEGKMRIVSPGHEEEGGPVAESFLQRINAPADVRERVIPLVVNHLAHLNPPTDRAVRRLARRLHPENIQGLGLVMKADCMGRPPRPPVPPASISELLRKASELDVHEHAPQPVLKGRHLLQLGMKPGRDLGPILHDAYEAQLEGAFQDLEGAFRWLKQQSMASLPPLVRRELEKLAEGS
jgi:tRNA nucleotidyltransferase (CCA-adding enzyme)